MPKRGAGGGGGRAGTGLSRGFFGRGTAKKNTSRNPTDAKRMGAEGPKTGRRASSSPTKMGAEGRHGTKYSSQNEWKVGRAPDGKRLVSNTRTDTANKKLAKHASPAPTKIGSGKTPGRHAKLTSSQKVAAGARKVQSKGNPFSKGVPKAPKSSASTPKRNRFTGGNY
jgi:hypothetical protein